MSGLRRTLGTWDVLWFSVAAVLSVRWIATAAAAGPSSLVMWALAFVAFYAPLAFTVIRLGARMPAEGGLYVWVGRAFGERAGFVAGWMYWMSTVIYFPGLLYFAAATSLFVVDPSGGALAQGQAAFAAIALAALALALAVNLVGLRFGKILHAVGAVGTWLPIAVIVVLGGLQACRFGSQTAFTAAALAPRAGFSEALFWSTMAFAFVGFEAAAFLGEEIRESGRALRRAVLGAGAIVLAVYVLGTAAVLVAVPQRELGSLQGIMQAISAIAERAGLGALVPAFAALLTLGVVAGVSAWLGATARLPFVAGLDRALPPAFGKLHSRWGTPWVSLLVQAAAAAVIAAMGQAGTTVRGAYDVLVAFAVISTFVPFLFLFAALARLERGGWARLCAAVGGLVTAGAMVLAAIPTAASTTPLLDVVKVVGGSALLLGVGAFLARRQRPKV